MTKSPFTTQIEDDLICMRCDNPSPLTGPGTNTFLLGQRDIAVIDPGPDDPIHLERILSAVPRGAQITKILVTHSHLDHSPNARPLADRTGAKVYGFGPDGAGRSKAMAALGDTANLGGGEGRDRDFTPDVRLANSEQIAHEGASLTALWTPGHYGNHMSFVWGTKVFTGDLVMAWATTLVSPPDGDVSDFIASCERLAAANYEIAYPAHGDPIPDPASRLSELVSHRRSREAEVLDTLRRVGPSSPRALTEAIYVETPSHLWPAAQRNVLAHLIDLTDRGLVQTSGAIGPNAEFTLR